MGKTVGDDLAQYLDSGSIAGLQQQELACSATNTCSNVHFGSCGEALGGVCRLTGAIDVRPETSRLSMVMRANPSPDWYVNSHFSYVLSSSQRI